MRNKNGEYVSGISGGPVFSNGKLVGVIKGGDNHGLIFTSAGKLQQLLLKPDLSCSSAKCIREERAMFILRAEMGNRTAQLIRGAELDREGEYYKAIDLIQYFF